MRARAGLSSRPSLSRQSCAAWATYTLGWSDASRSRQGWWVRAGLLIAAEVGDSLLDSLPDSVLDLFLNHFHQGFHQDFRQTLHRVSCGFQSLRRLFPYLFSQHFSHHFSQGLGAEEAGGVGCTSPGPRRPDAARSALRAAKTPYRDNRIPATLAHRSEQHVDRLLTLLTGPD